MTGGGERIRSVHGWVEKAEEDLSSAAFLMTRPDGPPAATICFHAQQAVEKFIKALLVSRGIEFPKIHDLGELTLLLPPDLSMPMTADERSRLSDHAVATRYPGDLEPITPEYAAEAIEFARRLKAAVLSHLGPAN